MHLVLLSLLCSLPDWIGILVNHGDYTPFSVSPSVSALTFDETHAYAPPARRFMLTGRIPAETDNFEHSNFSAGIPRIPPIILGGMGRLLGGLGRAFIAADCIFPAALFVLLYILAGTVIRQLDLRLLVTWSSILIPFAVLNVFWMGDDALVTPLEITRTPQPEISFFVLILSVVLLAEAVREGAPWSWTIGAGVASGAVVYCYYFYALAWGLTLGLMLLCGLFWRSQPVWTRVAVTLAMMIAIAIPDVMASLRGKEQGGQTFLLERMGAYTHRPDLLPLLCAVPLTVVLLVSGKKYCRIYPAYFVLTALVAASLYSMNSQIFSGYETQSWHFWKRLALPVCFFILATGTACLVSRSNPLRFDYWRIAARVMLLLLIVDTTARLTYVGVRVASFHRATNPGIAMLTWVRTHLPAGQVIGTINPELILLIPALTADYTYAPSGLRSLTSTAEIISRYFEVACLIGDSPSEIARLAAVPNHLGHSTELLQALGLSYTGDPAVYKSFVTQYRDAYSKCSRPRWRLDYLVIPASAGSIAQRWPWARVIYSNSLYRLLDLNTAKGAAARRHLTARPRNAEKVLVAQDIR